MKRLFVFLGLAFCLFLFNCCEPLFAEPQLQPRVTPSSDSPVSEQYRPTALSQADLDFGAEQLRKLISDRPMMSGYAVAGDPVWTNAVRGLAGETCGHRVRWNSEDLDKPLEYASDHEWPYAPKFDSYIRIRARGVDGPHSGEYLWSCLFYELFNLANHKEFNAAYNRALDGSVSKAEWITINTKLEYIALKKSVTFYRNIWLPQMQARGIPTQADIWQSGLQETYEKWIAQYWDKNGYPNSYWGNYYDDSIVPYVHAMKKWKQRQKLPLLQQ